MGRGRAWFFLASGDSFCCGPATPTSGPEAAIHLLLLRSGALARGLHQAALQNRSFIRYGGCGDSNQDSPMSSHRMRRHSRLTLHSRSLHDCAVGVKMTGQEPYPTMMRIVLLIGVIALTAN